MSSFSFQGREVPFRPGQSIGAALWAAGELTLRTTRADTSARGMFCGIGICHDCLVVVDGVGDQRACVTAAAEGLRVEPQPGVVPPPGRAETVGGEEVLTADVAVVGGGPAGMSAAVAACAYGARVVLLDSEARLGGQFWRHGPEGLGPYHHGVEAFHALEAGVRSAMSGGWLDHRPRHKVWRLETQGGRFVVRAVTGGPDAPDGPVEHLVTVRAGAVVVATGAHDKVLPFPGWELPGVLTAGGAQALLKEHGVIAGKRVVIAGTGPFLLSLAAGLVQAGAEVAGVYETGDARGWARRWRTATAVPQTLVEAAQYAAILARQRVPVRPRHAVVTATGRGRVESVEVVRLTGDGRPVPGSSRWVRCDALAVGWGFTPRLELAQQAGARVGVSSTVGAAAGPAIVADAEGRTGVPGLFVAGEVGGVGGASLAEVTGRLAGAAAAASLRGVRARLAGVDLARRSRLAAFAATMHGAHPVQPGWLDALTPETVVCRCEEVPLSSLRSAVRDLAGTDLRSAKRFSRCGMGWCQGRICGEAVSRLVADATGRRPGQEVDSRPVAMPVQLASLARSTDDPLGA